jgi:hypothetical protein
MTETKPKRRWFRFSIRDLLLLTVIAALTIGWRLDHRKLTKDNSIGFSVYYLRYAHAKDIVGTLQRAYAGDSDVNLFPEVNKNAVIARAPALQLDTIATLLNQLDVATASTANQTSGR